MLLIPDPKPEEPDAIIEQSLESQAPTTSLLVGGGVDMGENTLLEESKDDNEIITPADDHVAHDPAAAQPTLDNFVKDPEIIGEEPGEVKELVEDTAESPGITHTHISTLVRECTSIAHCRKILRAAF